MENYILLSPIGEGSFARVFKARRRYTGRLVAIKMISKHGQTQDDLKNLRNEISILRKVDHPNIMKMLEVFETDTDVCIVTELGRDTLFLIINDQQTLPEEVLRDIAAQLVHALQYLHSMRIIHRDIKPQNVLISTNGVVKLCDFGFARMLSNNTLFLNSIKGTPLYMAPELVTEQDYNEKVDIWSLGVILYELYYGKPPFYARSMCNLIQIIAGTPVTWPGQINPDFKDFLSKMLERDPELRLGCDDLLKEKFIRDVDMKKFDDEFYRFKTSQFEEAIKESEDLISSLMTDPDYQSVFINPSEHSVDELNNATKYLYDQDPDPDSPLASAFAYHFKEFISRKECIENALRVASMLLEKDRDIYRKHFRCGTDLFSETEMPRVAVDFFTQLILIPCSVDIFTFGVEVLHNDKTVMDNQSAERMKNHLLGLLFTQDIDDIAKTFTLMSYLTQTSESFLSVLSGNLSIHVIPIITSYVTHSTSSTVVSAGFSILSLVCATKPNNIQFIQPFSEFVGAIEAILSQIPRDIETFCLFASTLSFLRTNFATMSQMSDFQKLVGKRDNLASFQTFIIAFYSTRGGTSTILKALLEVGATKPETTMEYLSYISIGTSPFNAFPIDILDLDDCIEGMKNLLPVHQPSLLNSICSLPVDDVAPSIEKLIKFFENSACIEKISQFILASLEKGADPMPIFETIFDKSVLNTLTRSVEETGERTPFAVKAMLVRSVIAITPDSQVALESLKYLLTTVYSFKNMCEAAVIITAHIARLGDSFIDIINACNGFKFLESMLKYSINGQPEYSVRSRALSAVGNILKYRNFADDDVSRIFPHVFSMYKGSDKETKRFAAYALANIVYRNTKFAEDVVNDIKVITASFESDDPQTIEYSADLVCNIARAGEQYITILKSEGLIKKTVQLLENKDELATRILNRIVIFCKYEEGRKYLRDRGIRPLIFKMYNSKSKVAQQKAKTMVSVIDS